VNEKIAQQRRDLLREMSLIERMEFGSLAEEYREAAGAGGETSRNGPYYKHQKWEDGRNRSRRVPAEEAKALREAVEGRQRFESLSAEFVELSVASTRNADHHSKKNSTKSSKKPGAAKRQPS
jgi:hypothetical protein